MKGLSIGELRTAVILKWLPKLNQAQVAQVITKATNVYLGKVMQPVIDTVARAAKAMSEAFAELTPEQLAEYKATAEKNRKLREVGERGSN
jgi:hypothetical protein